MWSKVMSVIKKELRDLFREKRTILMTIVIPAILMPALLIGMFYLQTNSFEKESIKAKIIAIQKDDILAKKYVAMLKNQHIVEEYIVVDDIAKAIEEDQARSGLSIAKQGDSINIVIYYNISKPGSSSTIRKLADIIKELYVADYLKEHGLPPINLTSTIQDKPIGDPMAAAKAMTGYMLGLFLVLFTTIGNTYLGSDIGAGEKERGTLLPLLASPADREAIATGKWIALAITNLISATALIAGEGFAMWYIIKESARMEGGQQISIENLSNIISPSTIFILLLAAILLALFGAALQLIISIWSKTIREAQLYLSQIGLIIFLPSLAIIPYMISGSTLPTWSYSIPIVNTMALIYSGIMGNLTLLNVLVAFGANIVVATIVIAIVVKILDMEQVILRT